MGLFGAASGMLGCVVQAAKVSWGYNAISRAVLQHRDELYVLCDGQLRSSPRMYIKHVNEARRVALLFERNTNLGVLP